MTIGQWLTECQSFSTLSSSDCRLLLAHLLQRNSAWLLAHEDFSLTQTQLKHLNDQRQQLATGKPLAYLTGEQAFWDLTLAVNEHTLIPRPDTELIIEVVLGLERSFHGILDLGTGTGALALVLARSFPTSQVIATDYSHQALTIAQQNANRYKITNLQFMHSDWLTALENERFDLIVSNPPYIEADDPHLDDLQHEPQTALVAADKGLADLVTIISQAGSHLTSNGLLMVEHGYNQHQQVIQLFKQYGYKNITTHKDLAGIFRMTMAYCP